MSTTCITDFFSLVSNQNNTATDMEKDGSAILMSDAEPEVLDGIVSVSFSGISIHVLFTPIEYSLQDGLMTRRQRRSPKVT